MPGACWSSGPSVEKVCVPIFRSGIDDILSLIVPNCPGWTASSTWVGIEELLDQETSRCAVRARVGHIVSHSLVKDDLEGRSR